MGEAVVEVGSTANSYKILARVATGGMAEIFLARGMSATNVERYCVLKRILRTRATDAAFIRMFLEEARLAAQLQHPNIAQVYDIGTLGDAYFFTMEYVHGETVRAILQRARSLRRELPIAAVLTIVAGAAAGLQHAHARIGIDGRPLDIVHRDVSPSNLMVSYEGSVKVVDFGVAKASDRASETRSGTVKGKISYLSPEQARGTPALDRRSDLFSLGIVMWEMLTTERLYKRASDFENMTAIVNEPTPAPSSRKPHVPPELDAITLKLLAKSPGDRYQTGDELVEALEEFASRNQTMISSSALSRFLREMFGHRPEPWVEMAVTEEVPLTVTSQPIPEALGLLVDDAVERQLGSVPSLVATPFMGRPEDMRTLPRASVDPNQTLQGIGGTRASGPLPRIPPSGPQAFVPPRETATPEPERSGIGWQLVSIVMIAAIVGSLTMWIVMRDHGGSAPPGDAARVPDAAVVIAPDAAAMPDATELASDTADELIEIEPLPSPAKRPAIATAWAARNYRQVIALCEKAFPATTEAARCVVAACKQRQVTVARTFFAQLGPDARKDAIVAACRSAEIELEIPVKEEKPSCETDPMSCQH